VGLNKQRRFILSMFALMVSTWALSCRADFLDGTSGQLQVLPDKAAAEKGEKEFGDKITFTDGKFSSAFFATKGFKSATYRGEAEPNEAEFEVEQTSESDGVVTWLGEIREKRITGRLKWRRKDGTALNYTFEGTKN
jgi:hypothetical protein